MPSLKDLRSRIASVTATRKITKAMQMVAAAKLRRAQMSAEAARPYADKMSAVLSNLAAGQMSGGGEGASPLIAGTGKDQVHLLVVATAERCPCGGFNSSIVRLARQQARARINEGKEGKCIAVGKKSN
ncbi:MAG: F0F1 ATP synthase subunit gamma, partial [Devosiaceae bacterium]